MGRFEGKMMLGDAYSGWPTVVHAIVLPGQGLYQGQ
jgi:hypothetical protein